ncbi:MAG: class I SAM-dependent methyltransferase [Kiritimatiellae bacterium]|nr:class I SAM-dependent methyltransferase [Kiritimatiellia bacterium]
MHSPRFSTAPKGRLSDEFIAPPFTVLDARQGYWIKRKREWFTYLNRPKKPSVTMHYGRNVDRTVYDRIPAWMLGNSMTRASDFDPVLCELMLRWFCPPEGRILDPFAGESTKGLIAARLGYEYTGIEIRPEQVRTNRRQANRLRLAPKWIVGDAADITRLLPGRRFDGILTSPPYWNLEAYSSRDASGVIDYSDFIAWYRDILTKCAAKLRNNRFFVIKVGEVRNRRGRFVNFVGDTITILAGDAGLTYYNEAILFTPAGTLPLRAAIPFRMNRKLGKAHQNVLVFFKGNTGDIRHEFPQRIETADLSK